MKSNQYFFSTRVLLLASLLCFFLGDIEAQANKRQRIAMQTVQPNAAFQWKQGRTDYQMPWDGQDRHFIVYVPQQYQVQKATPVVLMFHGTTGTGHKMYNRSQWKETSDREGFIAVFPSSWRYPIVGKGQQTKWNSAGVQFAVAPGTKLMDDVGFVRAMLTSITKSLNVDKQRIYASGFSNGGAFITTRMLPEMSNVFAALSAGSGMFREQVNMQHAPIPVFQMLGTNDVDFANRLQAPMPNTATQWINDPVYGPFISNALSSLQLSTNYQENSTNTHSSLSYLQANGNHRGKYIFALIKNMGHVYPNGSNNPHGFIAAKRSWEFFKNHPKL